MIRYYVEWKSIDDDNMRVEIIEEGYNGAAEELTPAANPFYVSFDDDDFLYTPIRDSQCKLSVVGSNYLQELFSTQYQQFKINAYKNGVIVWCGFVKPEIYSQDYTSVDSVLTIEGMGALAVLDKIEYERVCEQSGFLTFWDLIKRAIKRANADWNAVYFPEVYGSSESNVKANVLQNMKLSEANFFTDDGGMSWYEVLAEVAKFMNWTITDWNGSLCFVDVDYKGAYRKYDLALENYTYTPIREISVQDISSRGSNHTIDKLGGYNKASVKVENYHVGNVLPSTDFRNLETVGVWENNDTHGNVTHRLQKKPLKYKMHHYTHDKKEVSEEYWLSQSSEQRNELLGASLAQSCDYKIEDGEPNIVNYNYDDVIYVREGWRSKDGRIRYGLDAGTPLVEIANDYNTYWNGGLIVVNFSVKELDILTQSFNDVNIIKALAAELKIGNKWWNGKEWTTTKSKFEMPLEFNKAGYMNVKTNKKLGEEPNGVVGHIIKLEGLNEIGSISFKLVAVDGTTGSKSLTGYYVRDIRIEHKTLSDSDNAANEADIIYENVVNEDFINELERIEFKISSWAGEKMSHGKVVLNNDYLVTLYSSLYGGQIRPEEHLIRRIRGQYSSPKTKLTLQLKHTDITPTDVFKDKWSDGIRFTATGGDIDYRFNVVDLKLVQNGN